MDNSDDKLAEIDRLLNDPDIAMRPDEIWSLLAEFSRSDVSNAPA